MIDNKTAVQTLELVRELRPWVIHVVLQEWLIFVDVKEVLKVPKVVSDMGSVIEDFMDPSGGLRFQCLPDRRLSSCFK